MNFPKHKCGLFLTHNEHKDYYQTVVQRLETSEPDFVDDDKQKCIETDELWELQWYPNTPIGFYHIGAPTLERLLELAATYDT